MKTEAEARELWCPFARSDNGEFAPNRTYQNEIQAGCNCLASACMAWEWGEEETRDVVVQGGGPERQTGATKGFCGLARRS